MDIDFGTIFDSFSGPDPKKIGPQRCSNATRKKIQKKIAFGRLRGRFCMDFGTQLGSGGGVRERRFGHFWRSWALLGGRWPQDAPRALPRPILDRFWWIFGRFLVHFLLFFAAVSLNLVCYLVLEVGTMSFHLAAVL